MSRAGRKIPVGILGATGMVGQRFITLLKNHPYFEVVALAASPDSAGKKFSDTIKGKWRMIGQLIPDAIGNIIVQDAVADMDDIAKRVELVFSAFTVKDKDGNNDKEAVKRIEENYASRNVAVVSNNSAHRWTQDVPMILPEINPDHLELIDIQRKNRVWDKGFIVVKPNCSIQSFSPQVTALMGYEPTEIIVSTYQAVSGAGKTMQSCPEMEDNVMPFIPGEEEKSQREPLRIWGKMVNGEIIPADAPLISATCIRVPVSDGHMASVTVRFKNEPTRDQILEAWRHFNPLAEYNLPSAPNPFITYFDKENRPQAALDRNIGNGMGICVGELRKDPISGWKFVGLSHNTIRGAAGGAILTAELLKEKGYI